MATVTLNAEERKAVVDGLIGNECCFEESERQVLNTLSDRTLARLTLNAKKKDKEEDEETPEEEEEEDRVENGDPPDASAHGDVKPYGETDPKAEEVPTKNQLLSNEDRQFLAIGRKVISDRRSNLIKTITANSRNPFKKEELQGMDLNALEKLGQLAQVENQVEVPILNRFAPSYFGSAAGMGDVVTDNGVDDDVLPLPVMNFKKNGKAVEA